MRLRAIAAPAFGLALLLVCGAPAARADDHCWSGTQVGLRVDCGPTRHCDVYGGHFCSDTLYIPSVQDFTSAVCTGLGYYGTCDLAVDYAMNQFKACCTSAQQCATWANQI